MTNERRKSIMVLSTTLIVGILIGMLVPAFYHKVGNRGNGRFANRKDGDPRKEWFARTINRVVKPDSAQAPRIEVVTMWASTRIDSIEGSANRQMTEVLDSVKVQLKPILTEEQWSSLEAFDANAKTNWNRGRGREH